MDKHDEFVEWLKRLTPDEIAEGNRLEHERVVREYKEFVTAFEGGRCYLCKKPLDSFSVREPCVHWLLKPKGFKKKHFPLIHPKYGFFQVQAFLRWVASQGSAFRNINDLIEEHSGKKKIDLTIRHQDVQWSFSCSDSDFAGHASTGAGACPHYHFQMRVDGRAFINYSEFHVPFNEEDLWKLRMMDDHPELFQHRFSFGEGMQELLDEAKAEDLVKIAAPTDQEDEAAVHIQTAVMAKEGEIIKGEDIDALIREAKEKGVTIASLAHRLGGRKMTVIEPGPGVPKPAERKGGRGSGKGRA